MTKIKLTDVTLKGEKKTLGFNVTIAFMLISANGQGVLQQREKGYGGHSDKNIGLPELGTIQCKTSAES